MQWMAGALELPARERLAAKAMTARTVLMVLLLRAVAEAKASQAPTQQILREKIAMPERAVMGLPLSYREVLLCMQVAAEADSSTWAQVPAMRGLAEMAVVETEEAVQEQSRMTELQELQTGGPVAVEQVVVGQADLQLVRAEPVALAL
jgi:hypothetical protein